MRSYSHPGGLLHVVRDDHHGEILFDVDEQVLYLAVAIGSRAEHGSSNSITSGSLPMPLRCRDAAAVHQTAHRPICPAGP